MNTCQYWLAAATTALAISAHAQVGPYHVQEGYFGKLTVKSSGSCRVDPVTLNNVWFGVLLDDMENPQGWGFVTASGQLLFWEEDYANISLKQNDDTGTGKDVSYSSLVGLELYDLVAARSGCNIEVLEPDTAGRTVMKWDAMRGKDTIDVKSLFKGFDASVCQTLTNGKRCSAGPFKGQVLFRGNWAVPD